MKPPEPSTNLQSLAEQVLLQQYAPPAVLVGDKGDILYVSGRTGKYLEPAAGKANWNVFAMAREGLRFELSNAFQRASRDKSPVTISGAKVAAGGGTQAVDITVQVLEKPEALRGLALIVFKDVPTPPETSAPNAPEPARPAVPGPRSWRSSSSSAATSSSPTREEMQTSLEELNSTNEELQSTNEELQSTNEELTTSREEMQSLNEELQTVNAEQQSRLDEFQRLSNDMKNLLDSTEIVTIFLDGELRVRRFTSGANKIFKLIPGDVGRPLTDITSALLYPELPEDAREVLRTLVFSEKPVATSDGRWFSVRIMPYRTEQNVIDGLVITFGDITVAKTLEARLRAAAKPSRADEGQAMTGRKNATRSGRPDDLRARAERAPGKRQRRRANPRDTVAGRDAAPDPRTAGPSDRAGDAERGAAPGAGGARSLPRQVLRPVRPGAGGLFHRQRTGGDPGGQSHRRHAARHRPRHPARPAADPFCRPGGSGSLATHMPGRSSNPESCSPGRCGCRARRGNRSGRSWRRSSGRKS